MNASHLYESINFPKNAKLSVVWRMIDSAINSEAATMLKHNVAMAKTFPTVHKAKLCAALEAVVKGKYIHFPDGSQARF